MAFDAQYLQQIAVGTGNGNSLWTYRDTAAVASVRAAGYLALRAGFKLGDIVIVYVVDNQATPTSITAASLCTVVAISATTGYPDLSDGTALTLTNT